jgi:hypothetical protein
MSAVPSMVRHRSPLSVDTGTGELVVRGAPEIPVTVFANGVGLGALVWAGILWFLFGRS